MKRSLAALALLSACRQGVDRPEGPGPERCEAGAQSAALQSVDRKVVGGAVRYEADGALRGREGELGRSQRLRREIAWRTVEKVLAPVPLSEALPRAPGLPPRIPAWHTWYGRDDISRLFHRLYGDLGQGGRKRRDRFAEAALDGAFAWNVRAVEELPNWPEERFRGYLESIDEAAEVAGVGGIGRVGYSPAAARHLLTSYPQTLACLQEGAPEPFVAGPVERARVLRELVHAGACERRLLGPFFVAEGETLRATLDDGGGAGAEIALREDAASAEVEEACRAGAGEPCEVRGPGTFHVAVNAGPTALDAAVTVTRDTPHPEWAACLAGAFPQDAAVVKAEWARAQFGHTLPVYATSAEALRSRLSPRGAVDWGEGDGEADPGAGEIYTLKLANGGVYRLPALHIMTKELDHWLWITLFWSSSPDEDFGADRPASLAALGAPWRNYKMCVVAAFEEEDADPEGGFGASHPSLARALAAVYAGEGGPSWCSNPYLEHGPANAGTNCVGCHQHGGADLRSEDILRDGARFPAYGRTLVRNNFPTDYSWAVNDGDRLGQLFADEEAYYAGAE